MRDMFFSMYNECSYYTYRRLLLVRLKWKSFYGSEKLIRETKATFVELLRKGDATGVSELYTEDCAIYAQGANPFVGRYSKSYNYCLFWNKYFSDARTIERWIDIGANNKWVNFMFYMWTQILCSSSKWMTVEKNTTV